jgi:FkbM family methyltransferase
MIIDNDYLISRIVALKKEQIPAHAAVQKSSLPQRISHTIPFVAMRKRLHSLYAYYKRKKELMNIPVKGIWFEATSGLATNFIQYCLENTLHFDTRDFFPEEDDALIQRHIDCRIKCFLRCRAEAMNEEQLACLRLSQSFRLKRSKEFYVLSSNNRRYYLSKACFEVSIWGYHYGLKQLPEKVRKYIADKDFLDIGAFIGDSALMLLQYRPNRIFAYEPVASIYQDLVKTIEREGNAKIHAVKKGIGDKETVMEIAVRGASSTMLNEGRDASSLEKIEVTTIDAECKNKKVGLIKMDIEGFEYFAIRGGLETIKRDKPVLLISIYHTGKDFFEIPPMIKACVPEYTFRYLDLSPSRAIVEKVLAVYV